MDNRSSADQQILATLVDRYLRDNNFSETRTTFRNEASFIFKSVMIHEELLVNMLSLDKILDDLVSLNEEKMIMLNNERYQTQKLLLSMKSIMNSYYICVGATLSQTNLPVPEPPLPPLQPNANSAVLPTGDTSAFTTTPAGLLVPQSFNTNAKTGNLSTRVMEDQERFLMKRERYHTQLLLFRMQQLIKNYGIESLPITNILESPLLPKENSVMAPQPKLGNRTPAGTITLPGTNLPEPPLPPLLPNTNSAVLPTGVATVTTTPIGSLVPQTINTDATIRNDTTAVMSVTNRKRKDNEATDAPSIGKKSRGRPSSSKILVQGQNTLAQSNNVVNKQTIFQHSSETQSIARNVVPSGSLVQDSIVSKSLFNPPAISIPINLLDPTKSTRTISCQSDIDISDTECFRVPPCNGEATPNLTKSITVIPPTDIESLPTTNILMSPPLANAKSFVVPQPKLGNSTPTGQNTLPQSNNVVNKLIVSQSSSETQLIDGNFVPSGSQVQESNVAKCLITEFFDVPPCIIEATPSLRKRAIVNPLERPNSIQSISCISSDTLAIFDKPLPNEISTYGSNQQNDLPELENLFFNDDNDYLGAELLSFNDDDLRICADFLNDDQDFPWEDLDFPWEGVNFSDQPTSVHLKDNASRSSPKCKDDQVISKLLPSTVEKVLSEKDMNIQGPNSITAMESFKKGTTNLNPKTNHLHDFDKENC